MLHRTCLSLLCALWMLSTARADEVITYYHNDSLGSHVIGTDARGYTIWETDYEPYGEHFESGTDAANAIDNDRWYTGHVEDKATGLTYMGARYYDPGIGRFYAVDAAAFDEEDLRSFNRYAYAADNPYRSIDPDGNLIFLAAIPVILKGLAVLGVGVTAYQATSSARRVAIGESTVKEEIKEHGAEIAISTALGGAGKLAKFVPESVKQEVGKAVADRVKGAIHHICTDKNCISTLRGGPWTPRFEAIFEKAGKNLQDKLNKVFVAGHKGPHPEEYHQEVFDRLTQATKDLEGDAYTKAVEAELEKIGKELTSPGSRLNEMIMKCANVGTSSGIPCK